MENKLPVRCSENENVALHLWTKRKEMAESGGISDNLEMTLIKAYRSICSSKTPIKSLKDLSQIKGVGKWIIRLMNGFFPNDTPAGASPIKNGPQIGKKPKGPKRYVPQKNSAAYALLITLYRGVVDGVKFMKKQELIDAAEASGLSRNSIRPDKVKGKPGQFGCSPRDWYTGWSCMKTLTSKGLVAKSSCPAKFMLTQEGQEAARECLLRSGLSVVFAGQPSGIISHSSVGMQNLNAISVVSIDDEPMMDSSNISIEERVDGTSINLLDQNSQSPSLESFDSSKNIANDSSATSTCCTSLNIDNGRDFGSFSASNQPSSNFIGAAPGSFYPRACASYDLTLHKSYQAGAGKGDVNSLAMPPSMIGKKFDEIYDLILILDDRERFGSRSKKVVDMIQSQFNIIVEVRRLPIGDGIWIVRHKVSHVEYVLDFIVERKKVDDLYSSIKDNRYKEQKLRLQVPQLAIGSSGAISRCGLQKLIYLVEGDLSALEAAESIKTACFTTEILEGFDVQRTNGFADTVRRYGFFSLSIKQYYSAQFPNQIGGGQGVCPMFNEFIKRCQDLEKITVTDVFSLQLMQIPQVTEEIALAVIDLYPTVLSLARAYSLLEGNIRAQEEMLKNQSKTISSVASKNIFKLVWGS
ncbi:crossover junction endonuclease MUS81 isoform X2 [Phalaenopsis equestris]|uniref:crossover junction endonuclease MUS81 isoform X2 n=1 Tax=Phalaenopsis equestris TaxID=78828 RepID=UPI0009E5656A|nr:crossover junction endonuclease MUS81 isoform X2 [Phalaenopsis equestris]